MSHIFLDIDKSEFHGLQKNNSKFIALRFIHEGRYFHTRIGQLHWKFIPHCLCSPWSFILYFSNSFIMQIRQISFARLHDRTVFKVKFQMYHKKNLQLWYRLSHIFRSIANTAKNWHRNVWIGSRPSLATTSAQVETWTTSMKPFEMERCFASNYFSQKQTVSSKLNVTQLFIYRLVNDIKAGSVPKINQSSMAFKCMENINAFLAAAQALGVPNQETFQTVDLWERQNLNAVVICLQSLGRKVRVNEESCSSISSVYPD